MKRGGEGGTDEAEVALQDISVLYPLCISA